jgi:hypothetical protein
MTTMYRVSQALRNIYTCLITILKERNINDHGIIGKHVKAVTW